jgi:hypothetical protein
MDLIALLPVPLITLAVTLLKVFGMPSAAAPWVALVLAAISTVLIRVFGFNADVLMTLVTFLIGWLGSMGTHEAAKNIALSSGLYTRKVA